MSVVSYSLEWQGVKDYLFPLIFFISRINMGRFIVFTKHAGSYLIAGRMRFCSGKCTFICCGKKGGQACINGSFLPYR
jgi:hypothetical protein